MYIYAVSTLYVHCTFLLLTFNNCIKIIFPTKKGTNIHVYESHETV